jgi:nucleolar protein 56
MSDDSADAHEAWFADLDPGDDDAVSEAIRSGRAERPAAWPRLAVTDGFADSTADYYERLHAATTRATRRAVREREGADDQQLLHAVRAMDDAAAAANELAERVGEWAGTRVADADTTVAFARRLADREPADDVDRRLVALADRVVDLTAERDDLRAFVERRAPEVAPNLTALAGPVLAARLIALAGGLEPLAKMPSGTVQVLGAEDALFAHLRGDAPSPKHGVIFTHEYVRGTRPEDRGSAARAVAGKFAIAARVDHYAGDRRPSLARDLDERMATIRERGEDA